MKEILLEFNKPTPNGRLYKEELFKSLPNWVPITFNNINFECIPLDSVLGTVESLSIEDGKLVGNVIITDKTIKSLLEAKVNITYTTSGKGLVNDKNEVTEFELTHVCPTLNKKLEG